MLAPSELLWLCAIARALRGPGIFVLVVWKRLGKEKFNIAVKDEIEKIKKMQENFAFEKSKIVGWIEKWFPNHDPNETLYPDHAKYLIDPDFYDLVKNLSGKSTLEIFTILNDEDDHGVSHVHNLYKLVKLMRKKKNKMEKVNG